MSLSGPTSPTVRVTAEGIPAAQHLAASLPDRVVPPVIQDTLTDLVVLGIDLMSINIMNTIRTEKSRGVLAESVQGDWEQTEGSSDKTGGTYEMVIGSALPYAQYVSREIGLSHINRNVFFQHDQKWRFIGIRQPIMKHPFLERTLADLHKAMPERLNQHFYRYAGEVQREVDALQNVKLGE